MGVIPKESKEGSKETGEGAGQALGYLKTVRVLASKLLPLVDTVVLMDGSEKGELGRRKNHQKGKSLTRLFLDISDISILSGEEMMHLRDNVKEFPTELIEPLFFLQTPAWLAFRPKLVLVKHSYQSTVIWVGLNLSAQTLLVT